MKFILKFSSIILNIIKGILINNFILDRVRVEDIIGILINRNLLRLFLINSS